MLYIISNIGINSSQTKREFHIRNDILYVSSKILVILFIYFVLTGHIYDFKVTICLYKTYELFTNIIIYFCEYTSQSS